MFILIFALWIIFNGQITLEITVIGLVISVLVYAFAYKIAGLTVKKDIALVKKSFYIVEYLLVLFVEIIKANVAVGKLMMSSKEEVEPAIVKFKAPLKSERARVVLANSITLTPGTITVRLQFDEFTVHCLDKSFAAGLNDSIFVKLLERIENV